MVIKIEDDNVTARRKIRERKNVVESAHLKDGKGENGEMGTK